MSSEPPRPHRPADDVQATGKRSILVIYGVYSIQIELPPYATVGDVRAQWRDRLKIRDGAVPIVNGEEVRGDTPLWDGDILAFVAHAGEIGRVS